MGSLRPSSPSDCATRDVSGSLGAAREATRGARGRLGERLAAEHLASVHDLDIVALNWRVAVDELRGELDLVARDGRDGTLVVCEVKTRTSARGRDGALASLTATQQRRIRRLTGVLLATGELRASRVRFDLVAVDLAVSGATLMHLPDAW
jgi:putative endonuclease